jgi:hypothetical protein
MTTDEQADQIMEILEILETADREVLEEFMALAAKIAAPPNA